MITGWSKELVGELQIFLSTVFYAGTYIGCRVAATRDFVLATGPLTFNTWRYALSTIIILACRKPLQQFLASDTTNIDTFNEDGQKVEKIKILRNIKHMLPSSVSYATFNLCFFGSMVGLSSFSMSTFGQLGLATVSAGKAAFIIGLYVVATPFAEIVLPVASDSSDQQRGCYKVPRVIWASAVISGIGTYFISVTGKSNSASIGSGEVLLLGAMLGNVTSIVAADAGSKRVDSVDMTCVEFVLTTFLSMIFALWFEPEYWVHPLDVFYDGYDMIIFNAVANGAACLLCAVGQTHSSSSRAALIFSLEGVFTVILGYIFLHETLSDWELFGCILMFISTIIATASSSPAEAIDTNYSRTVGITTDVPVLAAPSAGHPISAKICTFGNTSSSYGSI